MNDAQGFIRRMFAAWSGLFKGIQAAKHGPGPGYVPQSLPPPAPRYDFQLPPSHKRVPVPCQAQGLHGFCAGASKNRWRNEERRHVHDDEALLPHTRMIPRMVSEEKNSKAKRRVSSVLETTWKTPRSSGNENSIPCRSALAEDSCMRCLALLQGAAGGTSTRLHELLKAAEQCDARQNEARPCCGRSLHVPHLLSWEEAQKKQAGGAPRSLTRQTRGLGIGACVFWQVDGACNSRILLQVRVTCPTQDSMLRCLVLKHQVDLAVPCDGPPVHPILA